MKKAIAYSLVPALLIVALGIQFRLQAWQKNAPVYKPMPVPGVLGSWQGNDLKMEPGVTEMLDPDSIVFRRYQNPQGDIADLFCVFYHRQRSNHTLHAPTNCYTGSGWDFLETKSIALKCMKKPERSISARKATIRKGLDRRILYYWYYAGGHVVGNQYLNKIFSFYSAIFSGRTDGGLVTVSFGSDDAAAQDRLEKDFLPRIIDSLNWG